MRKLTGHVKGNENRIGLSNPSCGESSSGFGPSTDVVTSPKVQGDVASILTRYSLRQTRNRGWHDPRHSVFSFCCPLQHFPKSSLPASLSKDLNRNSNTPEELPYDKTHCIDCYRRFPKILRVSKFLDRSWDNG